jgi:hypothetical protein
MGHYLCEDARREELGGQDARLAQLVLRVAVATLGTEHQAVLVGAAVGVQDLPHRARAETGD